MLVSSKRKKATTTITGRKAEMNKKKTLPENA